LDTSTSEPRLARLRVRLISLVYEGLIATAVLFVATAVFTTLFGDSRAQPLHIVLQAYLFLVAGIYFVASWTGGRRTLPMRTWRIHLIDPAGRPPSLRRAALRYAFAAAGIVLAGAGLLWAFFDRDRQFLHDRLAGTRLVADVRR
jgi:uncharacterized RDD family membrane protein YckC